MLLIGEKGTEANKIKDEAEKDVLDQAHDAGSEHILPADVNILRIDSLEKSRNGQNGAVDGKKQIKLEHKTDVEQSCYSGNRHCCDPHHLDDRGEELIEQIVKIGDGSDQTKARFQKHEPVACDTLEQPQMPAAALLEQVR